MAIKIVPLTKAHPTAGYDNNKKKSSLFAHSSNDYWNAAQLAYEIKKQNSLWLMYVELPLMHMALELIVKAMAAYFDEQFDSKKYGHKTHRIIESYSDKIKSFEIVANDKEQLDLVKSLEDCWISVRYVESAIQYHHDDWLLFNKIMSILTEAYKTCVGWKT